MSVIQSVLLLFLLMGTGFFIRCLGIVDETLRKGLSSFIVNVALPLFLLSNMAFPYDADRLHQSLRLLFTSFLCYALISMMAWLVGRNHLLKKEKESAFLFGMSFSNVAFMGIPIVGAVLGPEGVFYTAVFNIFFDIFLWTWGVRIFNRDHALSIKSLLTPSLVAIAVGFGMFLFSLEFPPLLQRYIQMLASTATPLSMIVLGLMMAETVSSELFQGWDRFLLVGYRLILLPAIVFSILYFLGQRGAQIIVPTLILAMPVAANGAILAAYYDENYREMTRLVILSTLLSLLTLPLWMLLFEWLSVL